ncbi:hypothetical protein F4Z99_14935 [Candidatus Poribacteria bacterium]|nr:hypothetical protein [Candidatus Poribacteria bacterium]
MKDYEVIDAFIEYLREHGHPELMINCHPDKENRSSPDIDAIAGPFAIEHTSIDTLPDQRRNNDWFIQVIKDLEQELQNQISFRLSIIFPYDAVTKGQDWMTIYGKLKNWILEKAPYLECGRHVLDNIPDIPFQLTMFKEHDLAPAVRFSRFPPENDYLSDRIRKLLDRKAEKLKKHQKLGKTTVLLIENDDIALMDIQGRKILNAIREAYPFGLPIGVDKIWYVDTAELPDKIRFQDFTPDLLIR